MARKTNRSSFPVFGLELVGEPEVQVQKPSRITRKVFTIGEVGVEDYPIVLIVEFKVIVVELDLCHTCLEATSELVFFVALNLIAVASADEDAEGIETRISRIVIHYYRSHGNLLGQEVEVSIAH